jgi:hypothetical protein
MMYSRETQDLAQRLIDYETAADDTTESGQCAVIRVCEKLRLPLSSIVGVADYRSLLSRALTLAKLEAPSLSTAQVTMDGSLQFLSEIGPQINQKCGREEGVILLARLLGLFLTFLGAALTLQLVEDVSPPIKAAAESSELLPFKDILRQVVQLNDVSRRLESLADEHPVVEDALLSISGNIRNTAATLEVLAIIKSKSDALKEALQDEELKKQSKRYLM